MNHNEIKSPDLKSLLAIALPMIASQASETIMLFVDRLFLSFLGKAHIAASMSGGLSAYVFSAFFLGVIGYNNALSAQYYGAYKKRETIYSTTQSLYLGILFFPVMLLLIPLVRQTFIIAGHSESQVVLEFSYFRLLMFGFVFGLLRQGLVGFFLGIGKTRIVMLANLIGMLVNLPLNYIFIFGKLGSPAFGIIGAAYGTIAGSFVIFIILLIAYLNHPFYKENSHSGSWKLRKEILFKLFRYGLPAGGEMFLNVFAFNIFIQLMHSMGPDVAAAVTITFNYDMVAFIPMIGLGAAVTSMVGQQIGAGKINGAVKATYLSLKVGFSYAAVMMCLFVFGAGFLVRVFSGGLDPNDQELLKLSRSMLRLASIYTLADVTQLVFAGSLRGAGDTRRVMIISATMHWLMAIGAVILIRVVKAPPLALWVFFIGFIVCTGTLIFIRYKTGKWKNIELIDRHPPESESEDLSQLTASSPDTTTF